MHDPKKVLEICAKAPAGPYHIGGAEGSMPHSYSTQLTGRRPDGNHYIMAEANNHFKEESEALINFITLARTALPEFAQRVIELETENARLREKYEQSNPECNKGHENTLPLALWDCPMCTDELREENAKLREVAEVARKIYRQYAIDGDNNIAEMSKALADAGYGGEE